MAQHGGATTVSPAFNIPPSFPGHSWRPALEEQSGKDDVLCLRSWAELGPCSAKRQAPASLPETSTQIPAESMLHDGPQCAAASVAVAARPRRTWDFSIDAEEVGFSQMLSENY